MSVLNTFDLFFVGPKTENYARLKNKFILLKQAETIQEAQSKCLTQFFWVITDDITINEDFDFSYVPDSGSTNYVHVFRNKGSACGALLIPQHHVLDSAQLDTWIFNNSKYVDIEASSSLYHDVFNIECYEDYEYALENSNTELFWGTTNNIQLNKDFDYQNFYIPHDQLHDRTVNHVFIHRANNKDYYNGLFLLSKHAKVSRREIEYRHIVERKEWNILASGPVVYDKFYVETYEDYLHALEHSKTEMFWGLSHNVDFSQFDFSLYFTHDSNYDRKINHVFLHCEDKFNGIFLFSKYSKVSKNEIEHRHLVDKKECNDRRTSPVVYDKFLVNNYQDYLNALENSQTEMFWVYHSDLEIHSEFDFSTYFTHDNVYDRGVNHAFIHRVLSEDYYNGVWLLSKNAKLTAKEIEHRHIVDKKQWDILASTPVEYDKFLINDYVSYIDALENSQTEMFYAVPDYVDIDDSFQFDNYVSHDDYDRRMNHVFLNGKYHDGIILCSRHNRITQREFDFKFLTTKKEVDCVASNPKSFDMVFISYQEPNCDENYKKLLERFPSCKRVHGVKGIHQAHIEAAKLCNTDMFWIIDGDAEIMPEFNFEYQVPRWDYDMVHVWRSKNPINDLIYGYGGIKLFPTKLTLDMDTSRADMTTSISKKFKPVQVVSNITAFNTDPFNTWKSAFRECAKLASKNIDRQKDDETDERLNTWTTVGHDRDFGEYAIKGAVAGMEFGLSSQDNLQLINDFDWLKEKFNANT